MHDCIVRSGLETGLEPSGAQECLWFFQQDPATVAGLAIGGNGTSMGEAAQRLDGGAYQPMASYAIHLGDQAEAAAVFLEFVSIQPGGRFVASVLCHRRVWRLFRSRSSSPGYFINYTHPRLIFVSTRNFAQSAVIVDTPLLRIIPFENKSLRDHHVNS